jgi:hypothetical protein
MQKTVVVTMEGGVIQHIECPDGVSVVIRDYDIEDADPCSLNVDEHGNRFLATSWPPNQLMDQSSDPLRENIW